MKGFPPRELLTQPYIMIPLALSLQPELKSWHI